ncbi:hypothetical protein QQZ08_002010 [Neonectria magnoliae]|uniref:Major facilitator superfamily (MFS) profile domain-containing protein n=1 Tax=Neonectria magnoliae TaxID=2732573 RepID=A0ABR1IE26_9HYPO
MAYSLGLGTVNFVFALPAIKSIDTLGRRRWLILTLPATAVRVGGGALSFLIIDNDTKIGVLAFFRFIFAAAYSPGMGPIPFTLAAESFSLSHREAGTAWAISINFCLRDSYQCSSLSKFLPQSPVTPTLMNDTCSINSSLGDAESLGLISGLNVLAFILVFLLLEETKRRNLEDLDLVFAVSKHRFMSFQIMTILAFRRYVLRKKELEPQFYHDLIWDPTRADDNRPRIGGEPVGSIEELPRVEDAESLSSDQTLHPETVEGRRPTNGTQRVEKTGPVEIEGHMYGKSMGQMC